MARQLLSFAVAVSLAAVLPATDALAVELPLRKAGLWEMKMVRTGSPIPDMTMQHCTDAATDKQMSTSFSPGKDSCAKQDIQKTATGYVSDSVCTVAGMTVTSHAEITGDFNSAYTVKSTAHSERASGPARDSTTTIEAKWLGACKADQKPGDIMMPGGMKMNILELDKMKSMMPQLPQKAN
jgi:predicted PP-loop superfamily ATPase